MKFKNILLIDDDEDYGFLTKHSLEKLQISDKVNVLTNGPEALDFISDCIKRRSVDCPSVIFVDNHMDGMNGFTFLDKLSRIEGAVEENFKIYMVSSSIEDADKEKIRKYNIEGFIDKPLSLDKLRKIFI